jgi:hypothetical protein
VWFVLKSNKTETRDCRGTAVATKENMKTRQMLAEVYGIYGRPYKNIFMAATTGAWWWLAVNSPGADSHERRRRAEFRARSLAHSLDGNQTKGADKCLTASV